MTLQLALLPFEGMDEHAMTVLAEQLGQKGFACALLRPIPVPADAYDRTRDQYRVEVLLKATRQTAAGRVLGVTEVDLYAEGLNFVFGMAEAPGRAAVISVARLHFGADEAVFKARMLKEAVHELGHTLGLAHCRQSKCVMYFSNTLADTDRKGAEFCGECRARLAALGVGLG